MEDIIKEINEKFIEIDKAITQIALDIKEINKNIELIKKQFKEE